MAVVVHSTLTVATMLCLRKKTAIFLACDKMYCAMWHQIESEHKKFLHNDHGFPAARQNKKYVYCTITHYKQEITLSNGRPIQSSIS